MRLWRKYFDFGSDNFVSSYKALYRTGKFQFPISNICPPSSSNKHYNEQKRIYQAYIIS